MTNETRFEHRMLINGKLVEGRGGALANINPATEELLGEVSDASCEDMAAAIDAARDAFDSTDWSTNRVLRQRCLIQLQDALEQEREELREELIREVGPLLQRNASWRRVRHMTWPRKRSSSCASSSISSKAMADEGHG